MYIDVFRTFRARMLDECPSPGTLETFVGPLISHLNSYFYESKSPSENGQLFGSYIRGTALPFLNAIDLLYILPKNLLSYIEKSQSQADGKIQSLISQIFNGSIWQVESALEESSILIANALPYPVRLWPALEAHGSEYFLLSSLVKKGGQRFRPFAAERFFKEQAAASPENLMFLSKSTRSWAMEHRVPISGFMIDYFAADFIATSPYRNFSDRYHDCLLRDFFLYLAHIEPTQDSWEIPGTQDFIHRKGAFEHQAESAYHVVERVISNAIIRRDDEVRKAMKTLVGQGAISI